MNPDQKFTNLTPYKFPEFDYPPTLAQLCNEAITYAAFLEGQHIDVATAWKTSLTKTFNNYYAVITGKLEQSEDSFRHQMNEIKTRLPAQVSKIQDDSDILLQGAIKHDDEHRKQLQLLNRDDY